MSTPRTVGISSPRRAPHVITVAAAVVVAVAVLGVERARAQFTPHVTPILHCVTFHPDTKVLDVYLGYASSHTAPVTIPVGEDNFFFPDPESRNQPTEFLPGIHRLAHFTSFVVDPLGIQQLSWVLDGNSVSAQNATSLYCPGPVLIPEGPSGPQGPTGPSGPTGATGPALGTLRTVRVESRGSALAACAANEVLLSGGGECQTLMRSSSRSGQGWAVSCAGQFARAVATAICAKP